jgi:hypothetical protein
MTTDADPPWQRIMLATEHTKFDVGAERVAIALSRGTRHPLAIVVPLVSNDELLAEAPALAERLDAEASIRRSELLRAAAEAGMRVDVRVREDAEASRAIVDSARELEADLVVVRVRGHRGVLARLMVGAMATNVAAHAPCDVLMVPHAAQIWQSAVLAGIDNSPASMVVASAAARMARRFALPLHLVAVAPDPSEGATTGARDALRRAIESLAREHHSAEGSVRTGKPQEEIVATATERGADLIVVGRHGASGPLRRAVLGSTAQKVVGLASCPVLVVKT